MNAANTEIKLEGVVVAWPELRLPYPIDGGQSVKNFSCRFKESKFKESERNNSIISTSTAFTAVDI